MTNRLLIPNFLADKKSKPGGGGLFWEKFWNGFDQMNLYSERLQNVKNEVVKLTADSIPDAKELFIEVVYDCNAKSKTTRPKELWSMTNLDVVGAYDEFTYTLKGEKEDFKKLEDIISRSSYDKAKSGIGISKRDQTIFRELYAVTLFSNKTTSIEKRLDEAILSYWKADYKGNIDCIIELYENKRPSQYEEFFEKIATKTSFDKIQKRSDRLLSIMSNMTYRASLNITEMIDLLSDIDFGFICKITIYPVFTAQRCIPSANLADLTLLTPETDEIVGIIDSGVFSGLIEQCKFQHEKYTIDQREDIHHGTFVASRLLFGENLFRKVETGSLTPLARFLDVQVLSEKDGNSFVELDTLEEAIGDMVIRYPDIKIYNVSISNNVGIAEHDIAGITEFIDRIARMHDVLFVFSAGNQTFYRSSDYDDLFRDMTIDTKISSPSDALNIITVGSIVDLADENCICKVKGYPSPFTRKGNVRNNWKKPELVAHGGNVEFDPDFKYDLEFLNTSRRKYGVEGISSSGLDKNIGTSVSAPLVTRQCVKLLHYLKKSNLSSLINYDNNLVNIMKCILVHSTFHNDKVEISNDDLLSAYGFGVPKVNDIISNADDNVVSIFYCDKIKFSSKKHKLRFSLPDYLLGKTVEFAFTLTYNPPVDKNYPKNYNMISLSASLKLLKQNVDSVTGEITYENHRYLNPTWSWDDYQNRNFNVINFKNKLKSLTVVDLEVIIQMTVFEEYEKKHLGDEENKIFQSYSFILSVRDLEDDSRLRTEMISTNQFEVLLENSVEVEIQQGE